MFLDIPYGDTGNVQKKMCIYRKGKRDGKNTGKPLLSKRVR